MKIYLDWLNDYLEPSAEVDDVEHLLTAQGFPIENRQETDRHSADVVIDVEVTSNRSDCLHHLGIAREVAAGSSRSALGGRTLIPPNCQLQDHSSEPVETLTRVDNDAIDLCPLYTARIVRGVRVGPSPDWLARRLEAIGLRSVNNVVDITNYVLFEMGQPLHAFDMARLDQHRIVVRRAQDGESFVAIDGSKHDLRHDMLVIADARRPVAIGGIMGGMDSEVGLTTTDVLLESAIFDPLSVRRTSRTLKLASESSYRFERGVDPLGVEMASRRAAKLMCDLAGGTAASGVVRVGIEPPRPRQVQMRLERCRALLGIDLDAPTVLHLLAVLDLHPNLVDGQRRITCTIPMFRLDLQREIDLIEEVGRLAGLDQIEVRDRIEIVARSPQPPILARQIMGQVLVAHGYHETITFTFVSPKMGKPFLTANEQPVLVDNSSRRVGTRAEPMLRPSLIPSLLACRKSNQDSGNTDLRMFEVATTWSQSDAQLIERQRLALATDISADGPDNRQTAVRQMRGTIEELVGQLAGSIALNFLPAQLPNLTSAANVELANVSVGTLGIIDASVQESFGLQSPMAVAELDVEQLLSRYPQVPKVHALARFPAIERDLSVVVAEHVPWSDIEQAILAAKPALFEELRFITIYRGKPIAPRHKSISFRLIFRDPATTLRHEQVDGQVTQVIDRLTRQLNAELRE